MSAEEAAALGLSGPLTLSPEEAKTMGVLRSKTFVTDDDIEKCVCCREVVSL